MLNSTNLVGRVVRDPEIRKTKGNKSFSAITIAVTRSFKNQATNEYDADFIDVMVWSTAAENVAKYCGKGSIVSVKGRLVNRKYEISEDKSVITTGVIAERIGFILTKAPESEENLETQNNLTPADIEIDPNLVDVISDEMTA